jgi:putative ubiquitin-RnfH superfamily antitoxin RatB of RatAB toxin-antitoxin module
MAPDAMTVQVVLVFAPAPRQVLSCELALPEGSTVAQALAASGWLAAHPQLASCTASVWGRQVGDEQLLRHGDRLEWTRPLRVDPKVARRERFRRQGAGQAGLFAQRRAGGKAGY